MKESYTKSYEVLWAAIPIVSVILTSSAIDDVPIFRMSWLRWALTFASLTPIASAICLFRRPETTQGSSSRSRGAEIQSAPAAFAFPWYGVENPAPFTESTTAESEKLILHHAYLKSCEDLNEALTYASRRELLGCLSSFHSQPPLTTGGNNFVSL